MTETQTLQIPTFTLGDRLAKSRDVAGLSVQQMARELGVSRNTVSGWEHDRVPATRATLLAYASVTGVPMWWLEGTEPPDAAVNDRRSTGRSTKWYGAGHPVELTLSAAA